MSNLFRISGFLRPHAIRFTQKSRIPSAFFHSHDPSAALGNSLSLGALLGLQFRRPFASRQRPVTKTGIPIADRQSSNNGSYTNDNTQANNLVLYGFIGFNVAVYGLYYYRKWLYETGQDMKAIGKHVRDFTMNVHEVYRGRWYTVVTSCFSHFGFMHIFGNLLTAYFLGGMITATPGVKPVQIAILVLGSGIVGNVGYLGNEMRKTLKTQQLSNRRALGFSGSVMGLGVVAAMMYPARKILIYGILPMPLWALMAGYFAYDAYYLQQGGDTGISHAGHLGGLVFGALYYITRMRRGIMPPRF